MVRSIRFRGVFTLSLVLAACASGPVPDDGGASLVARKEAFETRLEENQRTARERAALLPEPLERFASADASDWRQARAVLELLEKKEAGFVYARVIELLPAAVRPGAEGEAARAELVEIGRIVRLASAFQQPDPEDWRRARKALQDLGSRGVDAAAVRLILNLRTQDPEIFLAAASELVALGAGAVRHLALAIDSPTVSAYIKQRCIDVLERIGEPAIPALIALLGEDRSRSARYHAARALGRIADPAGLEAVRAAETRESDPFVRCAMLDALAQAQAPEAYAAGLRAIGDEDLSVVKFGARLLAAVGDREALPALVDALDRVSDPAEEDVRAEILAALRLLSGWPGTSDPAWWRERLAR